TAAADDRRQLERACAQARGSRVHRVYEVVRGPRSQDRVHHHRVGTSRARALSGPHGSAHSSHQGTLTFPSLNRPPHMKRTTAIASPFKGIHVGIIMDGNGRWAGARGLPRTAGHRSGVRTARKIVEAATRSPLVGTVTLYAFSSDNWSRPSPEVGALMRLLRRSLAVESKRCVANGVRLTIVGRRDRLPASLVLAIQEAEAVTGHRRTLHFRLAVD